MRVACFDGVGVVLRVLFKYRCDHTTLSAAITSEALFVMLLIREMTGMGKGHTCTCACATLRTVW